MEITKIVLTGGPCAGKSSAMSRIQEEFTSRGYAVLFIPETASELILGGANPTTCGSVANFQKQLLKLQLEKERIFEETANLMPADKVLIVCDRGTLDNKAYMTEQDFQAVIREIGTNEIALRDRYDAVFHLVSAAKGAAEAYSTQNNPARTETPEEAAALDDKLISAWTGHPHFRVIDNSTSFNDKIKRLIDEIYGILGDESYEIERKYLIEYPDLKWLNEYPNCKRVEIIQTYLKSDADEEKRLRQRGDGANFVYFETKKRKISDIKRVEVERRISEAEYLELIMDADTTKRQIRKTRYCLTYENQYFEIDVYPSWDDKAILEIELRDENAEIIFPEQIKVIKEVTNDAAYKNASLATI